MTDIFAAIQRLDSWIEKNGWSGWDPYDIRGMYLLRKIDGLPSNLPSRVVKRTILSLLDIHPLYVRKLFRIKPSINAKGMGLFLSSYSNLYLTTENNCYLENARKCAEW